MGLALCMTKVETFILATEIPLSELESHKSPLDREAMLLSW